MEQICLAEKKDKSWEYFETEGIGHVTQAITYPLQVSILTNLAGVDQEKLIL